MLEGLDREARLSIAWLAGSLVYILAVYTEAFITSAPGPTIAAIVTGVIVAAIVRRAPEALAIGAAAGLTGLLVQAGAWIMKSAAIIASAGGGVAAFIALLYHPLAPALLAAGLTLFFREKKG